MIKTQPQENFTRYELTFDELSLDKAQLIAVLGYDEQNIPPFFMQEFDAVLQQAATLCKPCAVLHFVDACTIPQSDVLQLDEVTFASGKIINRQLRQAEQAVLFLCTIGPDMENWGKALMQQNDFMRGYLVDHLASALVEAAMDVVQDDLAADLQARGLAISNRFSPGYCGWHVSQQQLLFQFFSTFRCGIQLTESSLMLPIKSISGVIGVGAQVKRRPHTCGFCDQRDCVYRRK